MRACDKQWATRFKNYALTNYHLSVFFDAVGVQFHITAVFYTTAIALTFSFSVT